MLMKLTPEVGSLIRKATNDEGVHNFLILIKCPQSLEDLFFKLIPKLRSFNLLVQ